MGKGSRPRGIATADGTRGASVPAPATAARARKEGCKPADRPPTTTAEAGNDSTGNSNMPHNKNSNQSNACRPTCNSGNPNQHPVNRRTRNANRTRRPCSLRQCTGIPGGATKAPGPETSQVSKQVMDLHQTPSAQHKRPGLVQPTGAQQRLHLRTIRSSSVLKATSYQPVNHGLRPDTNTRGPASACNRQLIVQSTQQMLPVQPCPAQAKKK